MMNAFETFLLVLAEALQFQTLAPDAHGACLIIIKEGKIPLLFEFDDHLVPNTILLSTPLSPFPTTSRTMICEALLEGNWGEEEILSIKPDENVVYLHARFHPEIQSLDLKPQLQQFIETAKVWKGKIDTIHPPQSLPPNIPVFPYKA
jgi:hypothetical protein